MRVRPRLLTPGPVPVPERVLRAMARPVVHHRSPEFLPVFREIRGRLRALFETREEVAVLTSSGTGAMEATVVNLLAPGDRAVVVRGGKFGERWEELCRAHAVTPVCVDVEWGRAVEPHAVRAALEAAPDARALLVQATETSTGVFHPIEALARLVRERRSGATGAADTLLVVDAIAALGVHPLPMDAWELDAVVAGSQKAFGLPPGLSFVALSERAQAALGRREGGRYYLDLRRQLDAQRDDQTAFSAPVSLLFGLHEAVAMLLEHGLAASHAHHRLLAQATRAGVRALGLELFAASPSDALTAVCVPKGCEAREWLRRLRDDHGFVLAGGQGLAADRIIRIGHMGDVDRFDALGLIAALEATLADLGLPVKPGEGLRAAQEVVRDTSTRIRGA